MDKQVAISKEVYDFLLGQGQLEGRGFGESHPTRRGAFWWRTILRETTRTADSEARALLERIVRENLGELDKLPPASPYARHLRGMNSAIDAHLTRTAEREGGEHG